MGRERAGGLGGEVGRTRSHSGQTEGAQCPAERDPGRNKDDPPNAAITPHSWLRLHRGVGRPEPRTELEAMIQGLRPIIPSALAL